MVKKKKSVSLAPNQVGPEEGVHQEGASSSSSPSVKGDVNTEGKKEVCEIFNIEKDGKKETKKICGDEKIEPPTKSQIKKENKQLKTIFMVIGVIVLMFLVFLLITYKTTHFQYEGVKFKMIKEGNLIFYNTFFPVYNEENVLVTNYNFYIRNDPRKLTKNVAFEGEFILTKNMVINISEEFNCDGDGVIALANFVQLHEFIGIDVIQDPDAGCELTGEYTFVKIMKGNETRVDRYGPSCYRIAINECEILQGTERFMLETFVETNKILNQ